MVKEKITKRVSKSFDGLSPAKVAKSLESSGVSLSEKYLHILILYMGGLSKTDACEAAGVQGTAVWSVFNHPKMLAAMGAVVERFLVTEATPAALRTLYSIVTDDKVAAGPRIQAANSLLDRAGFVSKRNDKGAAQDGDITTFTADQLREQIAKLEAEMKDVTPDNKPDSKPMDSDLIDFA